MKRLILSLALFLAACEPCFASVQPTLVISEDGSLTLHGQPVTVVDPELKQALINIAAALHPQPPNEVCVEQINMLLKELERCEKEKP